MLEHIEKLKCQINNTKNALGKHIKQIEARVTDPDRMIFKIPFFHRNKTFFHSNT